MTAQKQQDRGRHQRQDRHPVDEDPGLDLQEHHQLVGLVERSRLDPHLARPEQAERAGEQVDEELLDAPGRAAEQAVEKADGNVVLPGADDGEAEIDGEAHHHLGHLEPRRDRRVERLPAEHVDEGERHHREDQHGEQPAERDVEKMREAPFQPAFARVLAESGHGLRRRG